MVWERVQHGDTILLATQPYMLHCNDGYVSTGPSIIKIYCFVKEAATAKDMMMTH